MINDFDQNAILEKIWDDAEVIKGIKERFFLIEIITSSGLNPYVLSTEDQIPLGLDDLYKLVSKRIRAGIHPTTIKFKNQFRYRIICKINCYDILIYAALTFPQLKRLAKKNVIRDLCDLQRILDQDPY